MAKIGLVMALDGEKEFAAGLKTANEAVKLAKEQLNDIKNEYKDNANSLEALTKKEEALTRVKEKATAKLEKANAGYKKANESHEALGKKVEEYKQKLEEEEKALNHIADTQGKASKSYKDQEKAIDDLKDELTSYQIAHERAAARVTQWQAAETKAGRELRNVNKEIDTNAVYLEEAKNSSDHLAKSIDNTGKKVKDTGKSMDDLGDEVRDTSGELKDASADAEGFGDALDKSLGKNRIAQLGLDLLKDAAKEAFDAIKEGLKVGIGFEAEMSRVKAISGATEEEFNQLKNKAEDLGRATVYTATESAEAMEQMALAGWKTQDIITGIDGVLSLAASSGMSIGTAAEYVSDNIQAWGESADYATHMADLMAQAMSNSSMTTADLGEAYGKTASTAHALGYDIEDVTAVLMGMANQGRKGGEAGSSLNTIMTRLATNTSKCADQLGALGVQIYDSDGKMRSLAAILDDTSKVWDTLGESERNALAKTVAGTRQFNAFSMIMKSVSDEAKESGKSLQDYKDILEQADGAAGKMADTMLDNVQGSVTLLKDALEGLAIVMYDKIAGPAKTVIDTLTGFISSTADALDGSKSSADAMADSVNGATKALKEYGEQADREVEDAATQAARAEVLINYLSQLNEQEELNEAQKKRVKEIVSQLNELVPGLSLNIDEQTGKVKAENAELKEFASNLREAMLAEAMMKSASGYAEQLADAKVQLALGEDELNLAKRKEEFYRTYYDTLDKARRGEIAVNGEALKALQTNMWESAFAEGIINLDEYENGLSRVVDSMVDLTDADYLSYFIGLHGEATKEVGNLQQEVDALNQTVDEQEKKFEAITKYTDDYTNSTEEAASSTEEFAKELPPIEKGAVEVGDKIEGAAGSFGLLAESADISAIKLEAEAKATDEATKSAKDFQEGQERLVATLKKKDDHISRSKSEKELARRAEEAAELTEQSTQHMRDAWGQLVEDSKTALGEVDPLKAWDGGGVTTTWTVIDNLESQIAGMEKYSENLEKLKDHVNKEISPEFYQYMLDMGMAGADFVDNLLLALVSDGGPERVAEISKLYQEAFDWRDVIAEQQAENAALWKQGLLQYGSSEQEFEALKTSITNGFTKVGDGTKQQLLDLVDQCQQIGVKLPEGFAESIANGDITNFLEVKQKLEAEIIGIFQGLGEKLGEDGGGLPEELAKGIEDGSTTIEEAYQQILELIAGMEPDTSKVKEATETSIIDEMAAAMEEGKETIGEAASGILDEVSATISGKTGDAQSNGKAIVDNVAIGITSQKEVAVAAASTMVATAIASAYGQTGQAIDLGHNIAAGVARGIDNGSDKASASAVSMIQRLFYAAQKEADTHSPSKRAEKEIGIQIPAGVAKGIDKGKFKSAEAAANMVGELFQAAREKMKDAKKSAKDIAGTWEKTLSFELNKLKTKKKYNEQFQISWWTTKGSGKNEKKVKKDAQTYYGEVLQVAQSYFDNVQTLQDLSDADQLKYWKKVRKSLKTGTQAWYDATKTIKELQSSTQRTDKASDLLSGVKDVMDVSLKAEVDFWREVLKTQKKGSVEYEATLQNLNKAEAAYNKKSQEIDKKYADASAAALERKTEAIKELTRTYADAFGIFEEFISESETGEKLLFNMQTQALGYEEWEKQFNQLKNKGILSENLLDEIFSKGVTETAAIAALNSLTPAQLEAYQSAYDKKMAAAGRWAQNDKDIEAQYQKDMSDAKKEYGVDKAELNAALNSNLLTHAQNIGEIVNENVDKLVNAIYEAAGKKAPASTQTQTPTPTPTPTQTTTKTPAKAETKSSIKKSDITEALKGAKKRSKGIGVNEKIQDDLWFKLVTEYGVEPTDDIVKKLAKIFGIKVGSKVSKSEKNSIAKAMTKAGFARGTRRLDDFFAWMDELGVGSEMVLRRADGARLNTNVMPGDAIVPAMNTDNLWEWSKVAPADMLNAIALQNANTLAYVNDMARNINVGRLNDSLNGASNVMLGQMVDMMSMYLPYLAQRTSISVDGRKLVNATSDYTSENFAYRQRRRRG